jgi:hypothetical protein
MKKIDFAEGLILACITEKLGPRFTAFVLSNSVLFRNEICDAFLQIPAQAEQPKEENDVIIYS